MSLSGQPVSRVVMPLACKARIVFPMPERRTWRFLASSGSKLPSWPRGVSMARPLTAAAASAVTRASAHPGVLDVDKVDSISASSERADHLAQHLRAQLHHALRDAAIRGQLVQVSSCPGLCLCPSRQVAAPYQRVVAQFKLRHLPEPTEPNAPVGTTPDAERKPVTRHPDRVAGDCVGYCCRKSISEAAPCDFGHRHSAVGPGRPRPAAVAAAAPCFCQ